MRLPEPFVYVGNRSVEAMPGPPIPTQPHTDLMVLTHAVRKFVDERDWHQFHTPKNLSCALVVDAGELLEHFQGLWEEEGKALEVERLNEIGWELADILIYPVRLSAVLGIELLARAHRELSENREKYPAEPVKGKALKHHESRR